MIYYELAEDLLNIFRGGVASKDDAISTRQILLWVRSIYAQKGQEAIGQTPDSYPVNPMWVKRYTCVDITYPAEAPCKCERLGFWVGRIDLPNLFTRNGRQAIERVTENTYGDSFIRSNVQDVEGIVTGKGLQARLRNKMSYNAFYDVNRKLYLISDPMKPRPKEITLHLAQTDPMIDLAAGETDFTEQMGLRTVTYPDQFLRLIRLEALTKEGYAMLKDIALKDSRNDNVSNP